MKLQVNRVAHPVTVLGPGRRLGLWVQGCAIGCPGCASLDTWDPAGGTTVDTVAFAAELADLINTYQLTGLTITGGEPTDQPDALADLVARLRAHPDIPGLFDVLVFTGRTASAAASQAPALWDLIDTAICGPYRPDQPSPDPLIASANQQLVEMTELGHSRFSSPTDNPPAVQTHVSNSDITLIGLPHPGDLPRLAEALRRRGITLDQHSWQDSEPNTDESDAYANRDSRSLRITAISERIKDQYGPLMDRLAL